MELTVRKITTLRHEGKGATFWVNTVKNVKKSALLSLSIVGIFVGII